MENKITDILKDLGIPMSNLGFKYIKEALILTINGQTEISGITKPGGLYELISEKHNTKSSRVERAIRHAMETCFIKCDKDTIKKYFGNTSKLTNRNFIAALSYEVTKK